MGVKILFFSRETLGQNSMFPEKGGQNSIFFPSALKKGGQNRGAYQPTSLKGCPPPPPGCAGGQTMSAIYFAGNLLGNFPGTIFRKFYGI